MRLRLDAIPLHALLVHFPVAGWTAASLLAPIGLAGKPALGDAALYCNAVALACGVAAIGSGFAELSELRDAALRDHAVRHMLLAVCAWTLYLAMLLLQASAHPGAAAACGALALPVLAAAGHTGARLVFHHGVPGRV